MRLVRWPGCSCPLWARAAATGASSSWNQGRNWHAVWSAATIPKRHDEGEADLRAEPAVSGALGVSNRAEMVSGVERSDKNEETPSFVDPFASTSGSL